uniref:Uncharacterized protein n=1 Tax=Panagrolaimus sp. JU765 TaxID=591449 RepID=A0AC34QFB0_9BILA
MLSERILSIIMRKKQWVVGEYPPTSSESSVINLTTADGVIDLICTILIALTTLGLTGLIFYFYRWLPKQWMTATRHLRERLAIQVLHEERLVKFCQVIGIEAKIIHEERDNIYPKVEELPLVASPGNYVDPFKCPSNLYEQICEKDKNFSCYKTLKALDNDIFLRKDDLEEVKRSRETQSAEPSKESKIQSKDSTVPKVSQGDKPQGEPRSIALV